MKSDTDVLRDIASWLVLAYQWNVRLSGMVYLHSIAENRMKGSHMTNLRMFQKLAGLENMSSVILCTTMWDHTASDLGRTREAELMTNSDFWGSMVRNGSEVQRFKNDKASAMSVIGRIVSKHKKVVLNLQREMSDDNKTLNQTDAGKALNIEIDKQREQFEKKLREQQEEMQDALKQNDMKYAQEVLDTQDKLTRELGRLEQNQKDLQVNNEKLLKEKEEQIQRTKEEMDALRRNTEKQGKEHADEMRKAREKMEADSKAFRDNCVESSADFLNAMGQTYTDLTAAQEAKVREIQANAEAQKLHHSPPPAYSPYQQPPPQPFPQPIYVPVPQNYPPQNYQQRDDTTDAILTGIGGAGAFLLAGAGTMCSVM